MSYTKDEALERLTEIRDEIESLISEAKEIIRTAAGRQSLIDTRANAYWIPNIEGSLEGRATMVSMQDTIEELEASEDDAQDKITELIGITQMTVSNVLDNFKDSIKIFETFKPFIYNIWNLSEKSEQDSNYFGVFPKIFMENLIYYHTKDKAEAE